MDGEGSQGGVFNPVNLNLYGYVGNNPVNLVDPDGKCTASTESGVDCVSDQLANQRMIAEQTSSDWEQGNYPMATVGVALYVGIRVRL
ncbi:hypothetical protein [Psychrobacter sp. I-STPA6b]|uniref:hypothetical protein n=1 Tax=Psychrobacter sp. I-STPA6b TaxID=2585718 RepID=UPI001D0CC4FB|nr:hypothetical protein [Psychrobacter sp. I-STPA6b]